MIVKIVVMLLMFWINRLDLIRGELSPSRRGEDFAVVIQIVLSPPVMKVHSNDQLFLQSLASQKSSGGSISKLEAVSYNSSHYRSRYSRGVVVTEEIRIFPGCSPMGSTLHRSLDYGRATLVYQQCEHRLAIKTCTTMGWMLIKVSSEIGSLMVLDIGLLNIWVVSRLSTLTQWICCACDHWIYNFLGVHVAIQSKCSENTQGEQTLCRKGEDCALVIEIVYNPSFVNSDMVNNVIGLREIYPSDQSGSLSIDYLLDIEGNNHRFMRFPNILKIVTVTLCLAFSVGYRRRLWVTLSMRVNNLT
jgi:hypothetical protein